MGFIYYLCCCCEAIFDCLTCCFRSKEDRKPSLSDFLPDSGGNQSLRKKSELELITVVSSPTDDEKSSPKPKFEHKEFIPRLCLITPGSFNKDVIIDLTTALTTTAPEPVLIIREALETSPSTDLPDSQKLTVDQIGDLEGSSMHIS